MKPNRFPRSPSGPHLSAHTDRPAADRDRTRPTATGRRLAVVAFALLLLATVPLHTQEFGGGVSVFIPESLYEFDDGSISIETSFETSMSISDHLSMPLGFAYNQVYGLVVRDDGSADYVVSSPWFYADSFAPYLNVKARLPFGDLYFDLFGGVLGNWNITMRPLTSNIERDISAADEDGRRLVFDDTPDVSTGFGIGYNAGVGIGLRTGFGAIELSGTFRNASAGADISGDARWIPAGDSGADPVENYEVENVRVRLRGISLGASARFRM